MPDRPPPQPDLPTPDREDGAPRGTADVPPLPVTFRPAHIRAVLLAGGGAALAVLGAVAVLLPSAGPGERLSFVLTGVLLLAAAVLLARPEVVAEESGVTVVNIIGRRRLAWAEILQVTLGSGDPWAYLDLSDGTRMAAMGIQPGMARQRAIADARALRALVEAHGVGRDRPPRG